MSPNKAQLRAPRLGRFLALTVSLLVPVIASAQGTPTLPTVHTTGTPRTLSLDEAVRIAESQSEAVRIARAGVERAQGQQYQARSQRLPQLTGSAAYTRTLASQFSVAGGGTVVDTTKPAPPPGPCDQYLLDASATTAERLAGLEDASRCALGGNPFASFGDLGFGAKNQYNLGLAFSQSLFAGGRISGQNSAANAGRRSAEIELTAQRAQLRLDVTQAYFDAALADRLQQVDEVVERGARDRGAQRLERLLERLLDEHLRRAFASQLLQLRFRGLTWWWRRASSFLPSRPGFASGQPSGPPQEQVSWASPLPRSCRLPVWFR